MTRKLLIVCLTIVLALVMACAPTGAATPAMPVSTTTRMPTYTATVSPSVTPNIPPTMTMVPTTASTPTPFVWDTLKNYPTAADQIEVSGAFSFTICVFQRSDGQLIGGVYLPANDWWVWITDGHRFGACGENEPAVVVNLLEETNLTQYSWIYAVKVGFVSVPEYLWEPPIQSLIHGRNLTITPPSGDTADRTIVSCFERKDNVEKRVFYTMVTLTSADQPYTVQGDDWQGSFFSNVKAEDVHKVQLLCLYAIGQRALNPAYSDVTFIYPPFVGIWYGMPQAPKPNR